MAKRDMVLSLGEMVKHLLEQCDIGYEVWDRSDYLTILHAVVSSGFGGGGRLARVVFLRDQEGLVMALLGDPEDTALPGQRLQRPLVPALPFELLESDHPHAELWIDPQFRNADLLVLDVGSGQEVIQVRREKLEEGFRGREEEPVAELQVYELLARITLESPSPSPLWDLAERLHALKELPSPTPFMEAVLGLYLLEEPDPEALLSLVAGESLAQPGYPRLGPALSRIGEEIEHHGEDPEVWDECLHLAMGHALSQQFPVAGKGVFGAPWCWRHFLLTARLSGLLAEASERPLDRRQAILGGWLHDVGHLYLAQVFPREFGIFQHLHALHEHRPIVDLEQHLLGVTHTDLGAALLHHWGVEEPLVEAVRHHHRLELDFPGRPYAELLLMADRLAHRRDGGDAASPIIPPWLMERHGFDPQMLSSLLERARKGLSLLDHLPTSGA